MADLNEFTHTMIFIIERSFISFPLDETTYDKKENMYWYPYVNSKTFKIGLREVIFRNGTNRYYNVYLYIPDTSRIFLRNGEPIRDFRDVDNFMTEQISKIKLDYNRLRLFNDMAKIRLFRIDFHSRIRPTEEVREFFTATFRENMDKLSKFLPNVRSVTSRKKAGDGKYYPVYVNYNKKTCLLYDEREHPRNEDFIKFEIRYEKSDRLKKLFGVDDIDDLRLTKLIDYPVDKLEEYFYSDLRGFVENFNLEKIDVGKSYNKVIKNLQSVLYGTPFNGIRDFTRLYNKLEKEEKKKRSINKAGELRLAVLEKFPEIDKEIKEWLIKERPDIAEKLYPVQTFNGLFPEPRHSDYRFCNLLIDRDINMAFFQVAKRDIEYYGRDLSVFKDKGLSKKDIIELSDEVNRRLKEVRNDIYKRNSGTEVRRKERAEWKGKRCLFDAPETYMEPQTVKRSILTCLLHPEGEDRSEFFNEAYSFLSLFIKKDIPAEEKAG